MGSVVDFERRRFASALPRSRCSRMMVAARALFSLSPAPGAPLLFPQPRDIRILTRSGRAEPRGSSNRVRDNDATLLRLAVAHGLLAQRARKNVLAVYYRYTAYTV